MNINFIFLVFHLWSFSSRALRVMVIGDSVDRYMVSDWCVENNGILYTDKTMNKFTALNELMSPHSRRFKSWEFRTCIALSRGINISYVFFVFNNVLRSIRKRYRFLNQKMIPKQ